MRLETPKRAFLSRAFTACVRALAQRSVHLRLSALLPPPLGPASRLRRRRGGPPPLRGPRALPGGEVHQLARGVEPLEPPPASLAPARRANTARVKASLAAARAASFTVASKHGSFSAFCSSTAMRAERYSRRSTSPASRPGILGTSSRASSGSSSTRTAGRIPFGRGSHGRGCARGRFGLSSEREAAAPAPSRGNAPRESPGTRSARRTPRTAPEGRKNLRHRHRAAGAALRAGLRESEGPWGTRTSFRALFHTPVRHGHGGDHRGDSGGFATRFKGLTCSPTSPQRLLLTTRRFRFRGGQAARPHDDLGCELLALRVPRRQLKATLGRPGAYDGRGLPVYVYPVTRRCHAARVRVGPPAS